MIQSVSVTPVHVAHVAKHYEHKLSFKLPLEKVPGGHMSAQVFE